MKLRNCIFSIIFLCACNGNEPIGPVLPGDVYMNTDSLQDPPPFLEGETKPLTPLELKLQQLGLVELSTIDSGIVVDIRYASENNFMGQNVYGDFNRAWLQPMAAEKLRMAQSFLKEEKPGYSLIVFDAARPLSIQQRMWEKVEMPFEEKIKYLSNPKNGSVHNYGAAVDVGILDETGNELDMGAPFDFFGEEAHPEKENEMLQRGKISPEHIANRALLRRVMTKAGFRNIPTEWWHFNAVGREEAKKLFELIE